MSDAARYLVIGGTGVIGHFVTRRLIDEGHRPLVVTVSGNTRLIDDVIEAVDVETCDIVDGEALSRLVAAHGITHIAHLGALLREDDPARSARVNVEGMANVLEAARVNGVKRVVFASTKGVYGPVKGVHAHPEYRPLTEDLPCNPARIYAGFKLACEHLGRIYRLQPGIEFVALRFASTVGPAKTQRHGRTSVHSKLIEDAMLGVPSRFEKGGDARTDVIYNDDAAHGIFCALTAPAPPGSVYNIGAGYGLTLGEFADAVRETYPDARAEIGPGTQYLHPATTGHCVMDISRATDELGYAPRYDERTMVPAYAAMMARQGIEPVAT